MDDYKRFFYYTKPSARMLNTGRYGRALKLLYIQLYEIMYKIKETKHCLYLSPSGLFLIKTQTVNQRLNLNICLDDAGVKVRGVYSKNEIHI